MGNGGRLSAPQQEAVQQGRAVSAANWLQRIRQNQIRQQQNQVVTRADLQKLQTELRRDIEKNRPGRTTTADVVGKSGMMLARGLKDINRSMMNPYAPGHRPAISQLPPPVEGSGIRQGYNLSRLQDPRLRGRDIRGKRIQLGGR